MKKAVSFFIFVSLMLVVPGIAMSVTQVVDFESRTTCSSVEGPVTVNPDLEITTNTGSALVIEEGESTCFSYGAPNSSTVANGCLGNPGGVTPVTGGGKGFAETGDPTHAYTFTFGGKKVTSFSIMMLDFGDFNPDLVAYHEIDLIGYDSANNPVSGAIDILSYNSATTVNPRSSDYGDLYITGDACTATPNAGPGVWTLSISGSGISKVVLNIASGRDPKIGFDNIMFNLEPEGTVCGDGTTQSGEQCDDGNLIDGDGCNANCRIEVCGDGTMQAVEECDDGNLIDGDGCDSSCRIEQCSGCPVCGDGEVQCIEQCDDGNLINGDGCDTNCRIEVCGNGILQAGEQCDDGNGTNGDFCDSNCKYEVCGNGIAQSGEQCDDGNRVNGDGCDSNCRDENRNQPPVCSQAYASPNCLWQPNHQMVSVGILGVTDPDGDPVTITVSSVTSDEPTASDNGSGGPNYAPDASGVGTNAAMIRSERSGQGDGRVYVINFTANDGNGGQCTGSVMVNVPHDQSSNNGGHGSKCSGHDQSPKTCTAINSGQKYDATKIN